MTAQRRYDLLINETEAVGFDYCKLRVSEPGKGQFMIPSVCRLTVQIGRCGICLAVEQMPKRWRNFSYVRTLNLYETLR
jgi:hypothetical protein